MMIKAIALAAASWGYLLCLETAECIHSGNGNGSMGCFVSIKLELDFHCRGAMVCRREGDKQSMKKSSIGGKQYLAYLWELGELLIYIIGGLAYLVSLRYHGLPMVQTQGIYNRCHHGQRCTSSHP